jgi:CpeT protein
MKRTIIVIAVSLLIAAPALAGEADVQDLIDLMVGSFSSGAQAAEDEAFFHIVLHQSRIWPDRSDGIWLYVEQAAADSQDEPYRQRIYRVRHVGEDLFASSVFTFPNPADHVGAWKLDDALAALSPADLTLRSGCTIYLRPSDDGGFAGSTLGRLCTSELRGATWASSEVVLDADGLTSWDRGWNDAGQQVWGARKAGYRFDRVAPPAEDAE